MNSGRMEFEASHKVFIGYDGSLALFSADALFSPRGSATELNCKAIVSEMERGPADFAKGFGLKMSKTPGTNEQVALRNSLRRKKGTVEPMDGEG